MSKIIRTTFFDLKQRTYSNMARNGTLDLDYVPIRCQTVSLISEYLFGRSYKFNRIPFELRENENFLIELLRDGLWAIFNKMSNKFQNSVEFILKSIKDTGPELFIPHEIFNNNVMKNRQIHIESAKCGYIDERVENIKNPVDIFHYYCIPKFEPNDDGEEVPEDVYYYYYSKRFDKLPFKYRKRYSTHWNLENLYFCYFGEAKLIKLDCVDTDIEINHL